MKAFDVASQSLFAESQMPSLLSFKTRGAITFTSEIQLVRFFLLSTFARPIDQNEIRFPCPADLPSSG